MSEQAGETKACPFCGEQIQAVAVKCKHCGEFLNRKSKTKTSPAAWAGLAVVLVVGPAAAWVFGGFGVDIERRCKVNGFGDGNCEFSNRGWSPGKACVTVVVRSKKGTDAGSSTACSDWMWPGGSSKKDVLVDGVLKACAPAAIDRSWTDACDVIVR